jgi:hypothetical protein
MGKVGACSTMGGRALSGSREVYRRRMQARLWRPLCEVLISVFSGETWLKRLAVSVTVSKIASIGPLFSSGLFPF